MRVALSKLRPAPWNPRLIRDDRFKNLCASIEADPGLLDLRPILATKDGTIYGGNMRYRAVAHLGWSDVPAVLSDIPEQLAKERGMRDNGAWGEWKDDDLGTLLAELKTAGTDLDLLGFDSASLDRLLGSVTQLPEEDEADLMPPAEPTTRPGDMWLLGEHRLLCGDSTNTQHVERLLGNRRPAVVLADPPYNVGFDYGANTDDEKSTAAYCDWNREWFGLAQARTASCVVLTCGIINLPMWIADIERTHRIISWVKENQNSRNYIGTTSGFNVWEPILVYGKAKKCVARDSFSIPIGIQADAAEHPCPKSLKAWSWLVENFSDRGDTVYDPFLGSGTTLLACEQLGRTAAVLEMEPGFCDVAIRRWEHLTGKTATLAPAD